LLTAIADDDELALQVGAAGRVDLVSVASGEGDGARSPRTGVGRWGGEGQNKQLTDMAPETGYWRGEVARRASRWWRAGIEWRGGGTRCRGEEEEEQDE
jgi:hypothetical protein